MFCFDKQKTAYDMRISDWSSDVCSSDLFLAVQKDINAFRHPINLIIRLMPDFPDLGLASRSAAFNRVLIFIALGELCILVGIAAILAEPLAHLLTGQPCSARYPANLRPFAGRFMQEVEPVLMLNANLLFAVLILIAQPHCPDRKNVVWGKSGSVSVD